MEWSHVQLSLSVATGAPGYRIGDQKVVDSMIWDDMGRLRVPTWGTPAGGGGKIDHARGQDKFALESRPSNSRAEVASLSRRSADRSAAKKGEPW